MIIRKATKLDIIPMTRLLKQLFEIEKDFSFDENKHKQGLQKVIDSKMPSAIFVAQQDQNIIGMISLQTKASSAEGNISVIIEDVIVDKNNRNKGIGSQLLEQAQLWAKEEGACRMELLADKNNKDAINFYKKHGWISTELICLHKKNI